MSGFPHLDATGSARMVDVTDKTPTVREARAEAFVGCAPAVVAALRSSSVPKGDVLAVARIAGIAAAKRTADLLPLAHVIGVHGATVDITVTDDGVRIETVVRTADRTGVEMEALTAASIAALAVVDMVKGLDRSVEITGVRLVRKSGGRSGDWAREAPSPASEPAAPSVGTTVRVRYFAAAADAAGTEAENFQAATVGEFRREAARRHGERMATVLAQCALLLDGVRAEDDTALPEGSTLDVLPPFAGG